MALSADRETPRRDGVLVSFEVKGGAKIHAGAMVVAEDGYAKPAAKAVGLVFLGRAEEAVDNTDGSDGDFGVMVRRKAVFRWNNATGVAKVAQADVGKSAYMVDDETVTKTATGASKAGTVIGVDADGVWVD